MKILHLSAECYPVAKAGGLADVVGALPRYQCESGLEAAVVMPWYDKPFVHAHDFEAVYKGEILQGSQLFNFQVLREKTNVLGFELFLIRMPGLLDRPELYVYPDESDQFIAFQHAVLKWLAEADHKPDLLHCHDHPTGLVPFFIENCISFEALKGIPTVFTVHNGEYQGIMNWHKSQLMPVFDQYKWGLLDWDNRINSMAAAIKCCWAFTTVSEGYLRELYAQPVLGSLFSSERGKAFGILNGIDTEAWNPENDSLLDYLYNQSNVSKGKRENKKELSSRFSLAPDLPLLAFIGRFAFEKGADLLPQLIEEVLRRHRGKLNMMVLGSGDKAVENQLKTLQKGIGSKHFALYIGYDEALAHKIYAAADFLLMPSRVEPCGLNQLYALRYGTIPIVCAVGGLKDTVVEVQGEQGNGFLFPQANLADALPAIEKALEWAENPKQLEQLRKRNMRLDYSWENSSQKYKKVYTLLIDKL